MVEVSLESQYASIHRSLIDLIDEITFKKNYQSLDHINARFDSLINVRLDPIVYAHLNKPDSSIRDIEELNKFLKQLIFIKNLVYDQTLITLPVLKSLHESVNMTVFEKQIIHKLQAKDDLSEGYYNIQKEYKDHLQELSECKIELSKLISETRRRLDQIPKPGTITLQQEHKSQLRKIRKLQLRTSILSELLLSLISSMNVNWSQDDFLQEIILDCGTIEYDDSIQNLIDQVSSDEEESD